MLLISTPAIASWDKLAFHSKFDKLPMAAFSVNSGTHKHGNVAWNVKWDGRYANGTCKIAEAGKIKKFHVLYDSDSGHHKFHNNSGGERMGGFYYDRHINKWRDPDGETCHTCTPKNGFPDHGHKDREREPKNDFAHELSRYLDRTLSEQDLKSLRQLQY